MAACHQCGAETGDEKFCGVCGARQQHETAGSQLGGSTVPPEQPAAGPTEPERAREDRHTSMSSQRGTGELAEEADASGTSRAGGGRRGKPKALEAGKVLNNRYEVVRRIGGGGMGAVYLAKDRNLGDAPRAVKEMIESHLDDTQHEKAIGDFKRESLLLTSLEHPSIPTIYDYFYDRSLSRFYLVMKYISGGDLAT